MADQKLTIGILETGRLPDELLPDHGDYPKMMAEWLAPFDAKFKVYPVLDGVLPDSPNECDLWVITGSRSGAYDDHDWIRQLEDFIRACRDADCKMIGICFGHQVIAQALGGIVEKSDKGWGLGVHEYATTLWPEILGPAPDNLRIQAFHQDQVTLAPSEASRIASSDFCENAALWYPGFALTVQGHPEMSHTFALALLENRRGTVFPNQDVDEAVKTVGASTTREALARYIRDNLASI
ncbi:MAG: type 1 glutamine amidotransferase [Paracoccaceae bacterium]